MPPISSAPRPHASSASAPPASSRWPSVCWSWMERRVGVIPLPVFAVLLVVIGGFVATGQVPSEMSMVLAVAAVGGFTAAAIGKRVPLLRHIGGPIILTTFVPAYLLFRGWLPASLINPAIDFTSTTKILYVFIAAICVGSILSMDRTVLVRGFFKIFVPLAAGSVAAMVVGTAVGWALGLGARDTFFYIVVPIMAGGVGEGAIPLSLGYAGLLNTTEGEQFARVLPPVMFGSLVAVVFSGALNFVGKKWPHLTGEGRLQPDEKDNLPFVAEAQVEHSIDMTRVGAAAMLILSLYLVGLLAYRFTGLPAPIAMLFLAVAVKVARIAPPAMEEDSRIIYKFFNTAFTFPMLFLVGVTFLPWEQLVAALAWRNLVTIVATVFTLMAVGFVVGRWVKLYPIEAAIVNGCHSGQGSSGDIAILTAANRLQLMPFAQISTRIGGALTVTAAIMALSRLV